MITTSKPSKDTEQHRNSGDATANRRRLSGKMLVLAIVGAIFATVYFTLGDYLNLEYLGRQDAALREYQAAHFLVIYAIAFVVYVVITGLSLPGAAGLTMACGWLFGFWRGLLLVSFASTSGATLAFLLTRYLLRDAVQNRFGERLASFNKALEREGAFYLFSLRLIPAVPFFVINVVMGLTPIRVWTFWWISQLGMLAGTAVFIYAGAQFPTLAELAAHGVSGVLTPQIVIAFIVLGLFPIVIKKTMARIRPGKLELAS